MDHDTQIHDADTYRTTSFIQNDTLLSLIFFGMILVLPLLVWDNMDDRIIFAWQGCMLIITASRWLGRYLFNQAITEASRGFWSSTIIVLTLLDGLGWGLVGVLFFPADSLSGIYLAAIFLIGMAGVGATAYSARMTVAIPYLLCVLTPFMTRLLVSGVQENLILAGLLGLLIIIYCFVADKLNMTLSDALDIAGDEKAETRLEQSEISRLTGMLESAQKQRMSLENSLTQNVQELEDIKIILVQYDKELDRLTELAKTIITELAQLKNTGLNSEQNTFFSSILTKAQQLCSALSSDYQVTNAPAPETKQLCVSTEQTLPAANNNIASVLLIDDDINERKKIEACLRNLGFKYESVENVPAAIATLCEASASGRHFDIAIANMWMPDMDGLSFAECLQEDPEYNAIKFIMINGGKVPAEQHLLKAGVDFVIHKPVNIDDLSQAIISLLRHDQKQLPMAITSTLNDSASISLSDQSLEESPVIDNYVIDGLRSSTSINFIDIVNNYLEEAPQLIESAKQQYRDQNFSALVKSIRELGSRSLHMGAIGLVDSSTRIEELINQKSTERVYGMLQTIEAEFIQVESALLAELTNGAFFSAGIKH